MEGGVDPQSGHQQRGPELDIPLLQTETPSQTRGVQFKTTFFKLMMIESTFTDGPYTQPSYTKPFFSRLAFTEPTHTEIPPPQAPPTPDHAPWMDLSAHINFLGTCMEDVVVIHVFTPWRIVWINIRLASLRSLSNSNKEFIIFRIA